MSATSGLDRYRRISTLGVGGMATVVLAEDSLLDRRVALKRLTTSADPRGLSRLRREALVGASVSHSNLVSIYDVITSDDGEVVIVMEYVPGETLADVLRREGKLPPEEALRILTGVAAGLDTIHREGIVHRDVKPANILLGSDGTVKLADLGIASVPDRTRITSAGAVLGTFSYMAPEQLEDARSTQAIDVYALAAVAFELLAGRKARPEPNPMALAHAIATQPPADLREAWPAAPEAAAQLLMRGMSRDPGARPASAGDLVRRLGAALQPENTAPMSPPVRRRKPAPALAPARAVQAAAAATPAAAAETAAARSRRQSRSTSPAAARSSSPAGSPTRPGPTRPRPSRRWLVPIGLLALGAAVLATVLSTGGSSPQTGHRAGANGRTDSSHTASSGARSPSAAGSTTTAQTGAATSAAGSDSSTTTAGQPSASSPVSGVKSFYSLAASHRYADAWALADPSFRNQLGGYGSFQAGQQADKSITFDAAKVVSQSGDAATVAVKTISTRTTGTQHCAGTVDLVRASGSWLVHQIHINCT